MLGNQSKWLGATIGSIIGWGVSRGLLPDTMQDPEIVAAITTLAAAGLTWLFPRNEPKNENLL